MSRADILVSRLAVLTLVALALLGGSRLSTDFAPVQVGEAEFTAAMSTLLLDMPLRVASSSREQPGGRLSPGSGGSGEEAWQSDLARSYGSLCERRGTRGDCLTLFDDGPQFQADDKLKMALALAVGPALEGVAAIACFEGAREYSLSRGQFDKPIAGYQLTQEKLADMLQEIVKAQLLSLRLARLKDEGKATPVMVSLAKRNNVKSALEIARMARSIYGANGVTDAYPPIRHMLNLESVFTYEGTHEVHTLVLGKAITGYDAFS